MSLEIDKLDFKKSDGLLPAIVQDADTGAVLMLAYMNREALEQTLARKRAVFYSPQQAKTVGERRDHRATRSTSSMSRPTATTTPC